MRVLAIIFALLLAPALARADPAQDQRAIAAIEQALPVTAKGATAPTPLARHLAETRTPAVSIAFVEDGRIKWVRAYGEAEAGRPATLETMFQAASLSKAVAAAGALRLVDQGRLDLDEDVNGRLKAWRIPASEFAEGQTVTLARLLSHTAGLTVSGYPGYLGGAPLPTTLQILAGEPPANTAAMRLWARPGRYYAYAGGGYTVAQLLMTEAAGEPFPPLMRRLVLRPAGMRRSTFEQPLPEALKTRAAMGHSIQGRLLPGGANTYPEYAAAGLWTTPSDYARFVIALQKSWAGERGALLKPATARRMMAPVLEQYALGVRTALRGDRLAIDHGGSNAGFRCHFTAFLDGSRQGVVVMTNGDRGSEVIGPIMDVITEIYGWPPNQVSPGMNMRAPNR